MAIRTISIVGVGLIGGSFALAARKAGFVGRIVGVSSPRTIAEAIARGVIDEGLPMDVALPRSDLIYLAQPVARILDQIETVADLAPMHALVTDAGSTKGAIVARAREHFGEGKATFIGGHPMAGKEGRGVAIADADLFQGATYILTPTDEQMPDEDVVHDFRSTLEAMGVHQRVMEATVHDRVVAWTSHLPQLLSTALADAVLQHISTDEDLQTAGDGLRDMTRLAASPYEMWEGILETNPDAIDSALGDMIQKLQELRMAAKTGTARQTFDSGQALRKKLSHDSH